MMNQLLRSTDITRGGEDFIEIASNINSEIHLICVDSDLFFLPDDDIKTLNLLSKYKKDVFCHEINSIHGLDGFLIEYEIGILNVKDISLKSNKMTFPEYQKSKMEVTA